MKRLFILAMLFLFVACSSQVSQEQLNPVVVDVPQTIVIAEPFENNSPEVEEEPKTQIIRIFHLNFIPNVTTVEKGTTVTWFNEDKFKPWHSVYSIQTKTLEEGKLGRLFNSDKFPEGESFSYTFNTPGNYSYFDPLFTDEQEDIFMSGLISVI
jgi:plastocyanin